MWIIDFGFDMPLEDAALFEAPFEYVKENVKPMRDESKTTIDEWWIHERPRVEMRQALAPLSRYIGTSMVAKHRFFIWLEKDVIPANVVIVVASEEDYTFGMLHSGVHEVWARAMGTQLREVESGFRYTPTTTFETFPFPKATTQQQEAVAEAAQQLNMLRDSWLNPPEVPEEELSSRTLTNLYNDRPTWLDLAHKKLDEAVFQAYGWPGDITNEQILERLLDLNKERETA